MVNATKPTSQAIKLLAGIIAIVVDNYSSFKTLIVPSTVNAINSTVFNPFVNTLTNANYSVPASTNLQIWGVDAVSIVETGGGSPTTDNFGYADNATGTNFVSLVSLDALGLTATNAPTGLLTIPTGKFILIQSSSNAGGHTTVSATIHGLETN